MKRLNLPMNEIKELYLGGMSTKTHRIFETTIQGDKLKDTSEN